MGVVAAVCMLVCVMLWVCVADALVMLACVIYCVECGINVCE